MHSRMIALIVPLAVLFSDTAAQTVQGCDPDLCLTGSCLLGDVDALQIGIANFSTPFSPAPFTWTTTFSRKIDVMTEKYNFSRDYYLGFPNDIHLDKTDNVLGCALFFHGLSQRLSFTDPPAYEGTGTCQDAMGAACVTDLLSQAQKTIAEHQVVNTTVCSAIQEELNKNGPQSCNFSQNGGFGLITAKDITGNSLPGPLELSTCHPTNRGNYSLVPIDHNSVIRYEVAPEIAYGVTPILTAFVSNDPSSETMNSQRSNLSLTCVKPVLQIAGTPIGTVSRGTNLSPKHDLAVFAGALVLAALSGFIL